MSSSIFCSSLSVSIFDDVFLLATVQNRPNDGYKVLGSRYQSRDTFQKYIQQPSRYRLEKIQRSVPVPVNDKNEIMYYPSLNTSRFLYCV